MAFLLKAWSVKVEGFAPITYYAQSRGKAISEAWGNYRSWRDVTFKRFLQICSAKRCDPHDGFGREITVSNRPAHYVSQNRQYVQFVRPDSDVILNSHPLDVRERRRPVSGEGE